MIWRAARRSWTIHNFRSKTPFQISVINNAKKMWKRSFYLQIDGIHSVGYRHLRDMFQEPKKKNNILFLEASRETDTDAKKRGGEGKARLSLCRWTNFLEVADVNRLPQEPLHLTCPSLNWHVKNLLVKLDHKTTQNTGINLTRKRGPKWEPLQKYFVHWKKGKSGLILTFCSSLTVFPWPIISCNVSFNSFSSAGGRG